MLPKIVAVIGPTASGKTALGVRLAQRFNGEIVSADAKQLFRRMDIGTAKETDLPVPQHLIDLKEPGERVAVGEYQALAYAVIDRLLAADRLPILVGGSGLYVEAVTEGYVFISHGKSSKRRPRYQALKLGIAIEREVLKARAAERLRQRVEAGLIEEVRRLLEEGVDPQWLWRCGIEYRYFSGYLRGLYTLEEAIQRTETATNQFIKRQYTWWRRHGDVHWVESISEAEGLVADFLRT